MSPFETITTDYSLILMSLELIGVVKVMPNAVKATDNGGLRSHKSIAHPNRKYRILLPKRLTGSNLHIGEWGRDDYIPPDLKMKVPFGRVKD